MAQESPGDDLSEAIGNLVGGSGKPYADAQETLIKAGGPAIEAMIRLLRNENPLVRLKAATVLAGIAAEKKALEAKAPLMKCFKDANPGIRHVGLKGLLSLNLAKQETLRLVVQALNEKEPVPTQLFAAEAAKKAKLREATPWLVDAASRISPKVARLVEEFIKDIDLVEMPGRELKRLSEKIESVPLVYSLRIIGTSAESLVGEEWGFGSVPAWELRVCLERAKGWMDAHRDEFPSAVELAMGGKPEKPEKPGKPTPSETKPAAAGESTPSEEPVPPEKEVETPEKPAASEKEVEMPRKPPEAAPAAEETTTPAS